MTREPHSDNRGHGFDAILGRGLTSHLSETSSGAFGEVALRKIVVVGIAAVVCGGAAAGVANPAATASGRLSGKTQISFGCPGPATEPPCNPWRPFAHARFSLAQRSADGGPKPGTRRTIISDARARFSLRVAVGSYVITPLRQSHTRGGERLVVQVGAGVSTAALVRFIGFPQMEHP